MLQVKIDGFDVWVFGDDEIGGAAQTSTNIGETAKLCKPIVDFQDLVHHQRRVVGHAPIKHLVQPCVRAEVLKCCHSIGLVEGDPTFQHCVLQVVPAFGKYKHLSIFAYSKSSYGGLYVGDLFVVFNVV